MSTITKTAYAAFDSSADRDDRIIAIKMSEKISLSAATKLVTAIAKDRGENTTKRGITDSMHSFLSSERRSAEDLLNWAKENGTDNTVRWIKAHDKIRVLVNSLFDKHEAALKAISEPGPKPVIAPPVEIKPEVKAEVKPTTPRRNRQNKTAAK